MYILPGRRTTRVTIIAAADGHQRFEVKPQLNFDWLFIGFWVRPNRVSTRFFLTGVISPRLLYFAVPFIEVVHYLFVADLFKIFVIGAYPIKFPGQLQYDDFINNPL